MLVVEADGVQYHVPAKDKKRDKEIFEEFGIDTIRFGGAKFGEMPMGALFKLSGNCSSLTQLDQTTPTKTSMI